MAGVAASLYECPVCTNFFECPKLFPCYHLVCRNCVLSWLQRTGGRGECPICRASILPATPQDQNQLEAQVDCLPTDMATQVLAESHKILSDPDECQLCPINVAGQNFCLQCSFKLCTPCTISHQKIPATSHHTLKKLRKLTVKTLAARHQVKCKAHTHQVVELYCPSHGELICCRCGATTHHVCPEIKEIKDVAKEERRKFKDQLRRMKVKERKMAKQVNDEKEKIKAKTKNVNDTFDELIQCIENRRRDVNILLQAEHDTKEASLDEVEKARMSLALPLRSLENLVEESPDDGLLEMLQQLASRLDNLESQMEVKYDARDVGCLVLDDQIITRLKSDLAKLGQTQQPQSQPTSRPAAGLTPRTRTTASGQTRGSQNQPTSTPAAGFPLWDIAIVSGQTRGSQRQPTSTPAAGFPLWDIAIVSGQTRGSQSQPTSTPAAGVTPRTRATASGQTRGSQSQPTSTPAAGLTPRTRATASGQIRGSQSQLTSTPAAGLTPWASATASGQTRGSQRQPTSTPVAEIIPWEIAIVSGQIRGSQSQPTSTPAAEVIPWDIPIVSGQTRSSQSQRTSTPAAGVTPTTRATNSGSTTAAKPRGAALARVLKVGDRVKLAPGVRDLRMQPGDTGTVTAIPSRIQAIDGLDPQGWVDVRWRSGECWHCMGWDGEYDLILA